MLEVDMGKDKKVVMAPGDGQTRSGLGVERDFVFHQEFLIPGASVGILECTHFSEWFWYNYTR